MPSVPGVIRLHGAPRHYEWGSPTAIPVLLGIQPDGRPVAELWFGAHPDDPSPAPDLGTTLDALLSEPLPFLVKLLAADKALSMQAHPSLEQARAGFAAEDARGVPRDAPNRNYRDRNHKPELLCALTEFEALCGFRSVEDAVALIDQLAIPELDVVRAMLAGPDGLRGAFTYLLTAADGDALAAALVGRAARGADGPAADALRAVELLAHDFPGDAGIAVSLLLNYVRLAPGEAMFLAAGNVHAYLRGLGVEVMANSDNVIRCALTPKHVDVAEVLAVTDFTPLRVPRVAVAETGHGRAYSAPVPDFQVDTVELGRPVRASAAAAALDLAVEDPGPQLVLCVGGDVTVARGGSAVTLGPGRAAFLPGASGGAEPGFRLSGVGHVFWVRADGRT